MPRAVCPRCKAEFTLKPTRLRGKARCPKCNKAFRVDDQPETDVPDTETESPVVQDPPEKKGPTVLKCTVCGESMETDGDVASVRCRLCGGAMRPEVVVAEPEPEAVEEPKEEEKPRRRRKFRRRKYKSKLSTRHADRMGGLGGRRALGDPIPKEYRIGFGRRTLALFLDGLIIGAVGSVLGVVMVMLYPKELSETFSYPEDVRTIPQISSETIPGDAGTGGDEKIGEEPAVVSESVPAEGIEEKELLPALEKPRLLFEGRLGQAIGAALGILVVIPFFGLVELATAASIGKKILGMTIRSEDGRFAQGNCLFGRYMIKYGLGVAGLMAVLATAAVARALGDIILIIGALDGLFFIVSSLVALSSSRQAVHDQLLFTAVYPDILPRDLVE